MLCSCEFHKKRILYLKVDEEKFDEILEKVLTSPFPERKDDKEVRAQTPPAIEEEGENYAQVVENADEDQQPTVGANTDEVSVIAKRRWFFMRAMGWAWNRLPSLRRAGRV